MKLWDCLCNIDWVNQTLYRSTRLTICVLRLEMHMQITCVWGFCLVRSLALTLCLAIPDRCTVPLTLPGSIFRAKRLNISGETHAYGNLFPASSGFEKQEKVCRWDSCRLVSDTDSMLQLQSCRSSENIAYTIQLVHFWQWTSLLHRWRDFLAVNMTVKSNIFSMLLANIWRYY